MSKQSTKIKVRMNSNEINDAIRDYGSINNYICHQINSSSEFLSIKIKEVAPPKLKQLSADAVKDIKMMLIYSGLKQSDIALFKGVSQSIVSRIRTGDCYSQIDLD